MTWGIQRAEEQGFLGSICITHHFLATAGRGKGRSTDFWYPNGSSEQGVSLQVTHLLFRDRCGAEADDDDDNGSEGTEDEGKVEVVHIL